MQIEFENGPVNFNKFEDLMKFFGVTSLQEFRDFWRSLNVVEKRYYRTVQLDEETDTLGYCITTSRDI